MSAIPQIKCTVTAIQRYPSRHHAKMAPTDHRVLAGGSIFFNVDLAKRHLTRSKAMGFASVQPILRAAKQFAIPPSLLSNVEID